MHENINYAIDGCVQAPQIMCIPSKVYLLIVNINYFSVSLELPGAEQYSKSFLFSGYVKPECYSNFSVPTNNIHPTFPDVFSSIYSPFNLEHSATTGICS